MKITMVKLEPLVNLFKDEPESERWVANVTASVGEDALGLAGDEEYIREELACDELDFTIQRYHNFMAYGTDKESFFESDDMVFRRKSDGTYWAIETDTTGEV